MLVISIRPHRFRSRLRTPGDEYDIPSKAEFRLFKALGWIIKAPEKVAPVVAAPVVEVAQAFVDTVVGLAPVAKPKRTYKRRDLSAQ